MDNEAEAHSHDPSYLVGSLQLNEKNINKSLNIIHDTHASV